MKTVISASRRTDIPAFYLKWFMDVISRGTVSIQNPLYKQNSYSIDLSPTSVEWIVFWSRNYKSFLKNYSFFNDYNLFFHFTILSHNHQLEKSCVPVNDSLKQIEKISSLFGSDRIIWRYDPIVTWYDGDKLQSNFDAKEFQFICKEMNSIGVSGCYFSFVTNYSKFKARFKKRYPSLILANSYDQFDNILKSMEEVASSNNIALYNCCNNIKSENIKTGSCISGKLLNQLTREKRVSEAKKPTRQNCNCTKSIDIGNYDQQPCYFGCIYCYANPKWKK